MNRQYSANYVFHNNVFSFYRIIYEFNLVKKTQFASTTLLPFSLPKIADFKHFDTLHFFLFTNKLHQQDVDNVFINGVYAAIINNVKQYASTK